MNAILPKSALKTSNLAHDSEMNPSDRRGPFRPKRLISARERRGGHMFVSLFRTIDLVILVASAILFASSVAPSGFFTAPLGNIFPFMLATCTVYWLLHAGGVYRFGRNGRIWKQLLKIGCVLGLAFGIAAFFSQFSVNDYGVNRAIELWLCSALSLLCLLHLLWWSLINRWRSEGKLASSIVIVGATRHAEKLVEAALAQRQVNILGIFDDRLARTPSAVAGVPVLGDVQSLLTHKITPYVDQIVVALDTSAKERVKTIVEKLRSLPNEVSLFVDVDMDNVNERNAAWSRVADIPLARVSGFSENEQKAILKRAQDLIVGLIALVLLSPLMLVVAISIKINSPGPVFFRQRRHGFNGEPIMVWKFRSMYTHLTDHTAQQQVTKGDPRVTAVGRFIRKTSIDELPQLFNVLKGDMSLVGPRPHAIGMRTGPDESALLVAEYAWRHRMKPGVTGWAAINGSRGPLDNVDEVRNRIALDIEYIERSSLWFDFYIMAMTLPCLAGDARKVR